MIGWLTELIGNSFLKLFWPARCLGCGFEGDYWCPLCANRARFLKQEVCPVCRSDVYDGCLCVKNDNHPDKLWCLGEYEDLKLQNSLKIVKYDLAYRLLSPVWSQSLVDFYNANKDRLPNDLLLVPIPLHQNKLLKRGFNQSFLIADLLAQVSGWQATQLLLRLKDNQSQTNKNFAQRQKNVEGIFGVNLGVISDFYQRPILLIDDVYTTGATLTEAVKTLKMMGFNRVFALTLLVTRKNIV